jgi:hypothetical protein
MHGQTTLKNTPGSSAESRYGRSASAQARLSQYTLSSSTSLVYLQFDQLGLWCLINLPFNTTATLHYAKRHFVEVSHAQ